jgi:serine/threonine protein kinase
MSSSKFSSSSIPFSSSQLFSGFNSHLGSSFSNSPRAFSPSTAASPASLLFAHNNNHGTPHHFVPSMTPPTPSLLSSFSANTLLSTRRLRLIASMFGQMCEAVAVCHDAGVSHRDIKPENFICCDSVELETAIDGDNDFGPQAKRKVIVKLTDFGLATTEEESGDVECGSKPYMSYECRNNLGPTYYPPAADVWSLGIVLINMLFHRNPWKDPTEGDMNFDNFLRDPTAFLLTKFTGIGREVATYLACHVLCTEVEDRVTARDFGKWVKTLPEMIAGRKAVRDLKMARIETKASTNKPTSMDQGLFAKSPVQGSAETFRKSSTSALTSSAPMLSHLPPPGQLSHQASTMPTPDLIDGDDADGDEMKSATTVDEQPTPADTDSYPSPDATRGESPAKCVDADTDDARSLSTHKRRKRGVRKGKAAQAALAAAAASDNIPQEERDEMLKELAHASQSLARHLSKTSRPGSEIDPTDTVDFPPLGTTPSQAAAAKKSKWKDMMKLNSANPELAALARRVAERDGQSGGNWSAPAELQHSGAKRFSSSAIRPAFKQTATVSSSGISSYVSTVDQVSTSVTSASGGAEEDDWRAKAVEAKKEREMKDEDKERARKAQAAAKALTAGIEPMGAFGANRPMLQGNPGHPRSGQHPRPVHPHANLSSHISYRLHTIDDEDARVDAAPRIQSKAQKISTTVAPPLAGKSDFRHDRRMSEAAVSVETASTQPTVSSFSSGLSSTVGPPSLAQDMSSSPTAHAASAEPPHRPKLKGQIQSLAKMLSGLKTKGKD